MLSGSMRVRGERLIKSVVYSAMLLQSKQRRIVPLGLTEPDGLIPAPP